MFALRSRVFVDWHRAAGREVFVLPPADAKAKEMAQALAIDAQVSSAEFSDVILPATPLREFADVEVVAERTREI